MAKNREEWAKEHTEEQTKAQEDFAKEQREGAEGDRFDEPDTVESEEEYHERLAAVRGTMIFGDTDTTAGASAGGVDTPSADNEAAGVAVSEKDAQAEAGDEEAEDTSDAEARRQVDVSAGTTASAEEVDEGAAEADDDEGVAAQADDDEEENLTPAQKAARTRARNRAESGE